MFEPVSVGSPMTSGMEALIAMAAATRFPLLIVGERGCGKRTAARLIHSLSDMRDTPFTEIAASEVSAGFFGNRGSSAVPYSPGTVYLTQCTKLLPESQRELLCFLQDHRHAEYKRARLIASAGCDLGQALQTGALREDLYYAMSATYMAIPPLRHRAADILRIADCLLERYAQLFQRRKPKLGPDFREFFLQHRWPGNVSQLEDLTKILVAVEDQRIAIAAVRSASAEFAANADTRSSVSLKEAAREAARAAERGVIEQALLRTDWNRKRAAEQLQVSYKALLYKVREFGLEQVPAPFSR